jgi:hypothetical protein
MKAFHEKLGKLISEFEHEYTFQRETFAKKYLFLSKD